MVRRARAKAGRAAEFLKADAADRRSSPRRTTPCCVGTR
jgi:hypothetical protein